MVGARNPHLNGAWRVPNKMFTHLDWRFGGCFPVTLNKNNKLKSPTQFKPVIQASLNESNCKPRNIFRLAGDMPRSERLQSRTSAGVKVDGAIPLWVSQVAVGQKQWYHFGIGAPPILVYISGDWDVHWGYGLLTHGQVLAKQKHHVPIYLHPTKHTTTDETGFVHSCPSTTRDQRQISVGQKSEAAPDQHHAAVVEPRPQPAFLGDLCLVCVRVCDCFEAPPPFLGFRGNPKGNRGRNSLTYSWQTACRWNHGLVALGMITFVESGEMPSGWSPFSLQVVIFVHDTWRWVQNQWYHFGVGAPPMLVYLSGDCSLGGTGF